MIELAGGIILAIFVIRSLGGLYDRLTNHVRWQVPTFELVAAILFILFFLMGVSR